MHISREQRDRLGGMSEILFGARSRWQKILQKTVITEEIEELDENMKYVQLSNRNGRPGTIMRTQRALELGIIRPDQAQKAKKVQHRSLTADELEEQMSNDIHNLAVSLMSLDERATYYAVALVNDNLRGADFRVLRPTESQKSVDDLMALLPQELAEKAKSKFTDDASGLDPEFFLREVVFAVKHPAQAKEIVDTLIFEKIEQFKKIRERRAK